MQSLVERGASSAAQRDVLLRHSVGDEGGHGGVLSAGQASLLLPLSAMDGGAETRERPEKAYPLGTSSSGRTQPRPFVTRLLPEATARW